MEISVILPIYNCKERLQRHLRGIVEWVHSVDEIIVVDSGSTDGSLELASEVLSPFRAKFIHNPPGLYQSWNAGVEATTQKWLYFSTVEDLITEKGLKHLHEVITRLDADVVISPPDIRNYDGSSPVDTQMPGNLLGSELIRSGINEHLFSTPESIAFFCGILPHGILGSSASNLYRTSFMKANPFPTKFGHVGDTAWGISVSPFVKAAFTPTKCANFLVQTTHTHTDIESQRILYKKLSEVAVDTLKKNSNGRDDVVAMGGWFNFHSSLAEHQWDWIAGLEGYNRDLKYEVDKMGENIENLKKALATIQELQQRILHQDMELKKAHIENAHYHGLTGAWKCLFKSLKGKN